MCVIVHQPPGKELTKPRAKRLWHKNPHGGGFAYINNHAELVTRKFMKFEDFWRTFRSHWGNMRDHDFLIHFRIATHGSICLENVHPFHVDEHTVMAHNGIISRVQTKDDLSDTRQFIKDVLPELPADWLDRPYLVEMVSQFIGASKLMFLTKDPRLSRRVYILNKDTGTHIDGMWFSNHSGVHEPYWLNTKESSPQKPTLTKETEEYKGSEDSIKWQKKLQDTGFLTRDLFVPGSEGEQDYLIDLRSDMGIRVPDEIAFFSGEDCWVCFRCLEDVDMNTGECLCWEKVDLICGEPSATCACTCPDPVWFSEAMELGQQRIETNPEDYRALIGEVF